MDTKPVDLGAVERRRFRSGFYAVEDVEALVADVKRLRDALGHMQSCRSCAEGSWSDCVGGRAAEVALGLRPPEEVLP